MRQRKNSIVYSPPRRYNIVVNAVTNWDIDIINLFNTINIEKLDNYEYLEQDMRYSFSKMSKRELTVSNNSVLYVKYKTKFRGNIINSKCGATTCFNNCVTMAVYVDKLISIKIPTNGSISITGCEDDEHRVRIMRYIWEIVNSTKSLIRLRNSVNPIIIYRNTLNNVMFELDITIDKNSILEYLYGKDNVVTYATNQNSAVIVKINPLLFDIKKEEFDCEIFKSNRWCRYIINEEMCNKIILDWIPSSEEKHNTFSVFTTGKVLHCGRNYLNMNNTYNYFIKLLENYG